MKDSGMRLSIFFVTYLYMAEEEETETTTSGKDPTLTNVWIVFFIIVGLWSLIGLVAFIKSIICFGSTSTMTEKLLGFLFAVFFGPFYFIYLYVNKDYCNFPARNMDNNMNRNKNMNKNRNMNRNTNSNKNRNSKNNS
jgi:hypothetical protein